MENDTTASASKKNTVYVGGFADEVREQELLNAFVAFGDIIEINLPMDPTDKSRHRYFAFLTYSSLQDAHDAIDNMDLNELPSGPGFGSYNHGRTLKVNIAAPSKYGASQEGPAGDRAIWTTEEWLKANTKEMDKDKQVPAEDDVVEKKADEDEPAEE